MRRGRYNLCKDLSNRVEYLQRIERSADDVTPRTWSGSGDSSHKEFSRGPPFITQCAFLGVDYACRDLSRRLDFDGFVSYIIELLRDPRALCFVIATGPPLAAYGFVFDCLLRLLVFPIFTR